MLFRIAIRNVLRNKRRSGLTFLSIGLGLTLVIIFHGVISGMDSQITDNFIRAQAGHIQIHQEGYLKKARLLSLDARIENPNVLVAEIESEANVDAVAQRVRFGALIGTRRESVRVMGLGIQPEREAQMGTLADSVIEGNFLGEEAGFALLGRQLAEDLNFGVGDVLLVVSNTATGALNAIDVEIQGIFHTGYSQIDSSTIVIRLEDAQSLLDITGDVTELVVMLTDLDATDSVAERITQKYSEDSIEIQTWKESGAAIWQLLELRRWLIGMISLIVVAIAALGIANTMLMSVFERTREIGTLMAIGNTPTEILRLFMFESAIIGGTGGLFGCAIGGIVVLYLAAVGISPPGSLTELLDLPIGTAIHARFSWQSLGLFFVAAMLVGMISALYPAVLASRQEPVEALRHV